MKVVLCGPSHSGKSCLRQGLKQVIHALHRKGQAPFLTSLQLVLTGKFHGLHQPLDEIRF